jgi:hypothetical protein
MYFYNFFNNPLLTFIAKGVKVATKKSAPKKVVARKASKSKAIKKTHTKKAAAPKRATKKSTTRRTVKKTHAKKTPTPKK